MSIVGPGSLQDYDVAPSPLLKGASEYEYVTILNPLTDDFAIRVAQDIPVNMPLEIRSKTGLVQEGNDVVRNYGLDLKNADFQAKKHITNDTIIKSGNTINLRGNEAQVAVKQLVDEVMQREGNGRLLPDPNLRKAVEERIIIYRGNIQELMQDKILSPRQQINEAITRSNEVVDDEPFIGLNQQPTEETSTRSNNIGTEGSTQERRGPGRPKKTKNSR